MSRETTIKAYAVREIGWRYNDEYYYIEGSGDVEKVFFNKKRAEDLCKQKNIEEFRTTDLGSYQTEDIGDLYSKEDIKELIEAYPIEFKYWAENENSNEISVEEILDNIYNAKILKNGTDSEVEIVMNLFKDIRFYEVVTVDVDVEI